MLLGVRADAADWAARRESTNLRETSDTMNNEEYGVILSTYSDSVQIGSLLVISVEICKSISIMMMTVPRVDKSGPASRGLPSLQRFDLKTARMKQNSDQNNQTALCQCYEFSFIQFGQGLNYGGAT